MRYDSDHDKIMAAAEDLMHRYDDALRDLADHSQEPSNTARIRL